MGKSTLIKDDLYQIAKQKGKKILFLLHRVNSLNQFESDLIEDNKTDVISLMTYQTIEKECLAGKCFDYSEWDYIVCDEFLD